MRFILRWLFFNEFGSIRSSGRIGHGYEINSCLQFSQINGGIANVFVQNPLPRNIVTGNMRNFLSVWQTEIQVIFHRILIYIQFSFFYRLYRHGCTRRVDVIDEGISP